MVLSLPLSAVRTGINAIDLGTLTLSAILLDFGVSFAIVNSQRAIFSLGAAYRSRLNGLFMSMFFIGGAIGSAMGAWIFARHGWPGAVALGVVPPILAFLLYLTEFRRRD